MSRELEGGRSERMEGGYVNRVTFKEFKDLTGKG